jgi:hypothetical protein
MKELANKKIRNEVDILYISDDNRWFSMRIRNLVIISGYFPPQVILTHMQPCLDYTKTLKIKEPYLLVIIMGNFNARDTTWQGKSSNQTGKSLYSEIEESIFERFTPKQGRFTTKNIGEGIPDHVFISTEEKEVIKYFEIVDMPTLCTDHLLLSIRVDKK